MEKEKEVAKRQRKSMLSGKKGKDTEACLCARTYFHYGERGIHNGSNGIAFEPGARWPSEEESWQKNGQK